MIVSGFKLDLTYQQCSRCICDNTIPAITFDSAGVCSLCHMHDSFDQAFPNDERGAVALDQKFQKIKKDGIGKKYDCIIGISGGRDSIYLLYLAVTRWKLRPLAVHYDNTWNTSIATENIRKVLTKLKIDLYGHLILIEDWTN